MNASVSDHRINLFDQEMQGSAVPSFVKERTHFLYFRLNVLRLRD